MYAIRSYYVPRRRHRCEGERCGRDGARVDEQREVAVDEVGRVLSRITSYNVCYTKLLRHDGRAAQPHFTGDPAKLALGRTR